MWVNVGEAARGSDWWWPCAVEERKGVKKEGARGAGRKAGGGANTTH